MTSTEILEMAKRLVEIDERIEGLRARLAAQEFRVAQLIASLPART